MYIEDAISSIIKQRYKNWKIWIYNDGSTSSETSILNEIIIKTKCNAEIIGHKKVGVLKARINLINAVKSGIIVWLDADDYFVNNKLFASLNYEFSKNNADIVFYNWSIKNTNTQFFNYRKFINSRLFILNEMNTRGAFNSLCQKAFDNSVLKNAVSEFENKMQTISIGEDRLISYCATYYSKNIKLIDEIFYCYRQVKGSSMHSKLSLERINDQIFVEKKIKDFNLKNKIYIKSSNYVNDCIYYPYLWYVFESEEEEINKKNYFLSLHNYITKNDLSYSIKESKKLHKKIILWAFYNKKFTIMTWIFYFIKNLKFLI